MFEWDQPGDPLPGAVINSSPPLLCFWKVKNTSAAASFENGALHPHPRESVGGWRLRDVCGEFSRSADPSGCGDSVSPLFWLPKTKEFQRKSGQDLTPSQDCCLYLRPPLLPPSLFALTHTRTHTFHGSVHTKTQTHSRGLAISCNRQCNVDFISVEG